MLDREWLDLLACPWCVTRPDAAPPGVRKGELELQGTPEQPTALRCRQCGRSYKIEDGIPNLLVEEAQRPEGELKG